MSAIRSEESCYIFTLMESIYNWTQCSPNICIHKYVLRCHPVPVTRPVFSTLIESLMDCHPIDRMIVYITPLIYFHHITNTTWKLVFLKWTLTRSLRTRRKVLKVAIRWAKDEQSGLMRKLIAEKVWERWLIRNMNWLWSQTDRQS